MNKTGQTSGIGGFLDTDYHTKLGQSPKTEGAALMLARKIPEHSTQKSQEALVEQITKAFAEAVTITKNSLATNKNAIITTLGAVKQTILRDFQASTTTKSSLSSEAKLMLLSRFGNEEFLQRANNSPQQAQTIGQILRPLEQLAKENPLLRPTLSDAIATIKLDLMGY